MIQMQGMFILQRLIIVPTPSRLVLVMTFKRRRQTNTAKPENTATPAKAFLMVVRQKCTYGNVAESELPCVRVATLLRSKYASILRVMS